VAWDTTWLTQLDKPVAHVAHRFVLLQTYGATLPGGGPGWTIEPEDLGRVTMGGGSVTPTSWGAQVGSWSVEYSSSSPRNLLDMVRRGSIVALQAGFAGTDPTSWPYVALGVVRNITGLAPKMRIECVDLVAGLATRPEDTDGEALALFNDVPQATTTVGAHLSSATTLNVGSSTGFLMETGATGLLYVADTTPYYLRWSASTATTFTVETAGALGTAKPASTPGGTVVRHVAYLRGHPMDIARKVLASTGTGANGTYDTLPAGWGYAIPDELIDHDDTDTHKAYVEHRTGGAGYEWEVTQGEGDEAGGSDDPVDNGLGWLGGLLQAAGLFLAMRQGSVTVRCARSPWDGQVNDFAADLGVDHVAQVTGFSAYDPQVPLEYFGIRVQGPGSPGTDQTQDSSAATVGTLPAQRRKVYTLDHAYQNESQVIEEARLRLYYWPFVVPERLQVRCRGLLLARLAKGDLVKVTLPMVRGRVHRGGWYEQHCLVASVTPDWHGAAVRLDLVAPPHPADEHG